MRRHNVFIALLIQMALASIAFAQTTQVTSGLNYFISTRNINIAWS
jgi:hypothetical protein